MRSALQFAAGLVGIQPGERLGAADWLFLASIVLANVVPCGLFIWGLTR